MAAIMIRIVVICGVIAFLALLDPRGPHPVRAKIIEGPAPRVERTSIESRNFRFVFMTPSC